MLCKDIINIIETYYPTGSALEWDNVGLLAGRDDKEVHKIYIALDATDEVIDQAIELGADLLVTHHPLIFGAIKKVTNQNFIGNRLVRLISHDISYYAMHTNYDVKQMGALAVQAMKLSGGEVLDVTEVDEEGRQQGIGRVLTLSQSMTLEMCAKMVKEAFGLPNVQVFGNMDQEIHVLAISPGSGKSEIPEALQKRADVLITGDIGHHEGIDAVAQGMAVVDAGHYGIEHIFIADIGNFIREKIENVEVMEAPITHPFQII